MSMDFANNFPAIIGILAFVAIAAALTIGGKKKRAPAPRRVSFYGNSSTKGGYFEMMPVGAPVLRQYSPDPPSLIALASGGALRCTNRAENGQQLHELLAGGPISMGVMSGLGEGATAASLMTQLAEDDAELVVLHFGEVEALFAGTEMLTFRRNLRAAVGSVRSTGTRVALCGLIRFMAIMTVTYDMLLRRDAFNLCVKQEAEVMGVPFIDLDGAGSPTVCNDLIHPTGEYHERIARHAAPQILAALA